MKTKIEAIVEGVGFSNKEEARFISINTFNKIANTQYATVKELLHNPPSLEVEITFRNSITQSLFASLTPLIIVDEVKLESYELFIQSKTYHDIRENLVLIS